jgi:hypothetical protein
MYKYTHTHTHTHTHNTRTHTHTHSHLNLPACYLITSMAQIPLARGAKSAHTHTHTHSVCTKGEADALEASSNEKQTHWEQSARRPHP